MQDALPAFFKVSRKNIAKIKSGMAFTFHKKVVKFMSQARAFKYASHLIFLKNAVVHMDVRIKLAGQSVF